jgi:hypothetical protein
MTDRDEGARARLRRQARLRYEEMMKLRQQFDDRADLAPIEWVSDGIGIGILGLGTKPKSIEGE